MPESTAAAAAAKSLQSCPTLCDPIDGSPPGSPVPGILQARTLEWVAISFSKAWKWKVKVKSLSCVRLFATPWTGAHQAPPSMGFSMWEYWSGLPLPSPIYPDPHLIPFLWLMLIKRLIWETWPRLQFPAGNDEHSLKHVGKKPHDLRSRLKSLTQRNHPFILWLCLIITFLLINIKHNFISCDIYILLDADYYDFWPLYNYHLFFFLSFIYFWLLILASYQNQRPGHILR